MQRFHNVIFRKLYNVLSSVKLAMALLISILVCCVIGVTFVRGERAWVLIFDTLWFNGLLVLLVLNVAFCFFGRIWGRRLTVTSVGMILFHLSFVFILLGITYNSLFYFKGIIRLTEGEALPNMQVESYDAISAGRFFSFSKLKGETKLIKMHKGYKIDGVDKKIAYEISVGEEATKKQGIVYITKKLEYNGFSYFREKEGYSVLITLYDKQGQEVYGAYVPLQSLKQKDGSFLYTTGTKDGPGDFPFPSEPARPQFALQVSYRPSNITERAGEVFFQVWPLSEMKDGQEEPIAKGKVEVKKKFDAGDYYLEASEIRYWAAMTVRQDPGKVIVLTSLWVGLGGMVITFIGRLRKGGNRRSAVSDQPTANG